MITHAHKAAAVIAAMFATLPMARVDAQSAPDPHAAFAGHSFAFVGGARETAQIQAAIERATAPMNFLVRAIARSRLRDRNPVYATIMFRFERGQIEVVVPGREAFRSAESGSNASWRGPDGAVYQLTQRLEGGRVVQTVGTSDGTRRNEFIPGPDGHTLTMHVRITSPHLPLPVDYTLSYRR